MLLESQKNKILYYNVSENYLLLLLNLEIKRTSKFCFAKKRSRLCGMNMKGLKAKSLAHPWYTRSGESSMNEEGT